MGSGDQREGRRGVVDNLIETLRRVLGRPSVVEIATRIPEASVTSPPPWPPSAVRPVDMRPACDIDGGTTGLVATAAVPGGLDLLAEVVCEPPPTESVSVLGPLPVELAAGVREPGGALDVAAVQELADVLELTRVQPSGATPCVRAPTPCAVLTSPEAVVVLGRPFRAACGVVAARHIAAALPVRRRALSRVRGQGTGLAAGMRALVRLSGLAPKDIRWEGFYGPLPDTEAARMEVDADSGCLLIWYARGAAAKATLTLAVGRRSQDGTLIAARFPQ